MGERVVIGLVGPAGCGKSTFAQYLVEAHGFVEDSFARPLKDLCAEAFGWDRARLDELAYKEEQDPNLPLGWTRRRVLQHIGTEGFRAIDRDYWVRQWLRTATEANYSIVVADVRFRNEADAIRAVGGWVVRLRRECAVTTTAAAHASEQEAAWIPCDTVFELRDGVEHTWAAAEQFLRRLRRLGDEPTNRVAHEARCERAQRALDPRRRGGW